MCVTYHNARAGKDYEDFRFFVPCLLELVIARHSH
jgi:hypothetical protein